MSGIFLIRYGHYANYMFEYINEFKKVVATIDIRNDI